MIDTGAFLTLFSMRFYDKLQNEERPDLTENRQRILNARGYVVSHYGKGTFSFQIGKLSQVLDAIVADISVDRIIELDFLGKCNENIDLQASLLRLNDKECAFFWEGTLGCYRVTAADDICISPRSEIVIPASVTGKNYYGRADYSVEPEPKFLESGRALVGRTLVKGNDKVPLRLMNVKDDVQKIYQGTLMGKMTAVKENLNLTTFAGQSSGKLQCDLED